VGRIESLRIKKELGMLSTRFRPELLAEDVYLARGAVVTGDVTIATGASVWFNAVVRADTEKVSIGPRSNVQDGAILHADPGFPCHIGEEVSVGHAAIVHGATIERRVIVGMHATVLNGAVIGENSIIGAGSLVKEGMQVPAGSLVVGVPGRVVRPTHEADHAMIALTALHYVESAIEYRQAESAERSNPS
jgi:carbonic anhydrase/acetyltransferase-like protein (isoleucine patch superfamily)